MDDDYDDDYEQDNDDYGIEYERKYRFIYGKERPSFAEWLKATYPEEYKIRSNIFGPYGH